MCLVKILYLVWNAIVLVLTFNKDEQRKKHKKKRHSKGQPSLMLAFIVVKRNNKY